MFGFYARWSDRKHTRMIFMMMMGRWHDDGDSAVHSCSWIYNLILKKKKTRRRRPTRITSDASGFDNLIMCANEMNLHKRRWIIQSDIVCSENDYVIFCVMRCRNCIWPCSVGKTTSALRTNSKSIKFQTKLTCISRSRLDEDSWMRARHCNWDAIYYVDAICDFESLWQVN